MRVDRKGRWTLAVAAAFGLAAAAQAAQGEWLSLCSKCLSPSITAKSGIGTAHAAAEARITRQDAVDWCENWQPGDKGCVREQLASPEAKTTFRATADCLAGRITPIDGQTYSLAGKWPSGIERGRTRWRDAKGQIVGADNASNGLGISQQWEVLCPGPLRATPPAAATVAPGRAQPTPYAQPAPYFVGQAIEAKYGPDWVRGRIDRIRQVQGRAGPELAYEVSLVNGGRGIIPARMLRPVPGR
ncbi:MAG: hypothetical protein J0H14_26765 [Alphaproteobacteria bacterium]|nr:hypothetical protein [Alphaproteobacteria bacterium]